MKKIIFNLIAMCSIYTNVIANDPYPWRFEGICQEFKDNPIIFEAGGHYGVDTIKFSNKWPQATIISFEPNPNAFEKLFELSKLKNNIFPFGLAVGDFNGSAVFYLCYGTHGKDPIFEGASSLLPASESMQIHYMGPKINVDCVILDDWCKQNEITHIDFMWLDLEGMELQALKSSPEILKTVKVIYTETNFQEFRLGMTQYIELKNFLENSGFRLLSHWYQENLQGNAIFVR